MPTKPNVTKIEGAQVYLESLSADTTHVTATVTNAKGTLLWLGTIARSDMVSDKLQFDITKLQLQTKNPITDIVVGEPIDVEIKVTDANSTPAAEMATGQTTLDAMTVTEVMANASGTSGGGSGASAGKKAVKKPDVKRTNKRKEETRGGLFLRITTEEPSVVKHVISAKNKAGDSFGPMTANAADKAIDKDGVTHGHLEVLLGNKPKLNPAGDELVVSVVSFDKDGNKSEPGTCVFELLPEHVLALQHVEKPKPGDNTGGGNQPAGNNDARIIAIEREMAELRTKIGNAATKDEATKLRTELEALKNQVTQLAGTVNDGFARSDSDANKRHSELLAKFGGGGSGGGSSDDDDDKRRGGSRRSATTTSERTTKSSKSGSPWLWALVFVIVLILGCLAFMAWQSYSMHAIHQPWAPVPSQPAQPAAAAPAPQVIYVQPAAPQVVQGQPHQGQGFQPAPVQSGRSRREMPDEGPRVQPESAAPQGPQLGAKPVSAIVPHPYPGEELYRSPPEQNGTLVRAPQQQTNYGQVAYADYGQSYNPAYCAPVERMQYVVPVVNPLPLPPAFRGHTRVDPVVYSGHFRY